MQNKAVILIVNHFIYGMPGGLCGPGGGGVVASFFDLDFIFFLGGCAFGAFFFCHIV